MFNQQLSLFSGTLPSWEKGSSFAFLSDIFSSVLSLWTDYLIFTLCLLNRRLYTPGISGLGCVNILTFHIPIALQLFFSFFSGHLLAVAVIVAGPSRHLSGCLLIDAPPNAGAYL